MHGVVQLPNASKEASDNAQRWAADNGRRARMALASAIAR